MFVMTTIKWVSFDDPQKNLELLRIPQWKWITSLLILLRNYLEYPDGLG